MIDLLIEGCTIIDGSGASRFDADVAVQDSRIVAIGPDLKVEAKRVIDARGLILAPGFIDCHTHDDTSVTSLESIRPKMLQGVTTVIAGNCGLSAAPLTRKNVPPPLDILSLTCPGFPSFRDFLDSVEGVGPYVNAAFLVGHTTLRVQAMERLDREAGSTEIARMRAMVDEALAAGAFGVSTGTYYPPAGAATVDEIARVCAGLDADIHVLASHLRDEGDHIIAAIDEAIAVADRVGVQLVISHHKLAGVANHGRSAETLPYLEKAGRNRPLCMDCYPYEASSTMLSSATASAASSVLVAWSKPHPEFNGRDLDLIAAERGISRTQAADLAAPGGGIFFLMSAADVRAIATHPLTMIGSDGLPHDLHPHPRLWGTFPRLMGRLARDEKWLTLEAAVHKVTGMPAQRFHLPLRGCIRVGYAADMVLFDADRIADNATYEKPCMPPDGIASVFINGQEVVKDGTVTQVRAGNVLRSKSHRPEHGASR
jgi:N-acyl-D-amino-acid deacylase